MEKDSSKFGQLRPIYSSLVSEIVAEQTAKQKIRDDIDENEEVSLVSDGHGGKIMRPSRVSMHRRKGAQKRPGSAATLGNHRRSMNRNTALLHSKEAPGKLEGERASILSKATQGNVDPNTGQSLNRRQELMPVKSVEVLARNHLDAELTGQAHGRISRTQKELMQHVHNAQQMNNPETNPTGSDAEPHSQLHNDSNKNQSQKYSSTNSSSKDRSAVGVKFAVTNNLDAVAEEGVSARHKPTADADLDATLAVANLVRMLNFSKSTENSNNDVLRPSQMLAMRQKSSFMGDGDLDPSNVRSLVALREQASFSRSSFFSASVVAGDERISRVQSQRDLILKGREDVIKQRILKKELHSLSKAELLQYEQRQRAWAIAVVSLARMSLLTTTISRRRIQQEVWVNASATKKAIGFIERWWRRGRVRIMFRRHPWVEPILRRNLLPYMVRIRLRRKRRSATLIIMFLQDSTGMSETMRAIYAFRQTVVRLQRWIRSWIEVQYCRMRILWIKCEKMYRVRMRLERGNEPPKLEVRPTSAISATNYFTETVEELNHRRKQLGRLLEDQENARATRQEEARFAEETAKRKVEVEQARLRRRRAVARAARGGPAPSEASMKTVVLAPIQHLHVQKAKKHVTPWQIRIKSSASNIKIYDLLRDILRTERRRHVLNLTELNKVGVACVVGTAELRRYLRNPAGYDGAKEISKKLADVQVVKQSPAQIYRSSFLLLTKGGIDALELLLNTNRYIKFG